MTGASIPYHLRPHKAVDRRLFVDLLARYERWLPLSEAVYVSMGAYPLEDHKLMYRSIGIKRLLAFDYDQNIVDRQKFNIPADTCSCLHKCSLEVISNLSRVLDECGFSDASSVIVWLDYTDPSKISEQIREFQALLGKLKSGDIVRVTVNAHPQSLGSSVDANGKPLTFTEMRPIRFLKLKQRIADFLPAWVQDIHINEKDFPRVLAGAFAAASGQALSPTGGYAFVPLSIVRYADGQQMLTVTGTIIKRGTETEMRTRLGLNDWPFASESWEDVHHLLVPALTVRERLLLERAIVSCDEDKIACDLGFKFAGEVDIKDFLLSYKKYFRFYPTLLAAEL